MAKYAVLLRGVNVAGKKLAMADLARIVEGLGGRDVTTYLQSGNVVYSGTKSVATGVEGALRAELGLESAVIVRSGRQLAEVVSAKPFTNEGPRLSVTFLATAPAKSAISAVPRDGYGADEFVVSGTEIYLHTPNGYGRSKLTNAFWERKLSVVATTRNWNTVLALADMTA